MTQLEPHIDVQHLTYQLANSFGSLRQLQKFTSLIYNMFYLQIWPVNIINSYEYRLFINKHDSLSV